MLKKETLIMLSENQKNLDEFILEKNNFKNDINIFKKRAVAFFVELGEYANEERAFKFWSKKDPSNIEIRLEEYIDGLHFIFSLGNYISYDYSKFEYKNTCDDIIDNYLNILSDMTVFINELTHESYSVFFNDFLNIMYINQYSEQEVIEMYKFKNNKNYDRQNNNY